MRKAGSAWRWAWLLPGLWAGCAGSEVLRQPRVPEQVARRSPYHPLPMEATASRAVNQFTFEGSCPTQEIIQTSAAVAQGCDEHTTASLVANELLVDTLVEAVLARNPKLAQMLAAWQAASARYPQVMSLEDPMVTGIVGPASIGSSMVDTAYRVEASQKFPFPGKRALRGQMARAEAAAVGGDADDMRLQLIESTKDAFFEYYLVERSLEVNEENLRLLADFQKTAENRFRAGQAPQQDILQADVEIGRQRERGLALKRMRKVAIARINTLLHFSPDNPLPPPPRKLSMAEQTPPVEQLRAQALASRPDLQSLMNRLRSDEASLALAHQEYKPDVEVMGAYDAFWQSPERDLRPMVGVRMNVPVQLHRRQATIIEAAARIAQRQAELESQVDQICFQVQEAYERVTESEQAVRLYEATVLPSTADNVKAAQAAYVAGQIPFLSLVEAQRSAVMLRDRYYEIQADYFRRRANLERVVGGSVTTSPDPMNAIGTTYGLDSTPR